MSEAGPTVLFLEVPREFVEVRDGDYSHICLAGIVVRLRADATHRFDFNLDLDIQFGASLMALLTNSWPREGKREKEGEQESEELEPEDTNSRGTHTPHDLNVR